MNSLNYFNYFTEIEQHFWQKRGAHLLVSPLDWAIVETWQKAGISLPAVLKGIDRAFESYGRSRRAAAGRQLKSLAYCVDAVLEAAEEEKETAAGTGPSAGETSGLRREEQESFSRDQLRDFFARAAERLAATAKAAHGQEPELALRVEEVRSRLSELSPLLDSPAVLDLEDLERRLTVLEEKLTAALTSHAPEEFMLDVRREIDRQLAPYRRKMTAPQLAQLERQYMQKRLWERYNIPRLSLFYLT